MTTLTNESFGDWLPEPDPMDRVGERIRASVRTIYRRLYRTGVFTVTIAEPTHDRTVVTVCILLCGSALLWHYGESAPIVALVSSGWTLALTFWFRSGTPPESRDN